jgi:hypothetical protein
MLTGQQPYQGKAYTDILLKILTEELSDPATSRPDLAPGLLAAIRKAMAKDPTQRFASATAFLAAIRPFADPSAPIAAGEIEAEPSASAEATGGHPAESASAKATAGSSASIPAPTAEGIRLNTTPLELSSDVTVSQPAKRRWIPVLAGVGGLAVVAAVAVWFLLLRNDEVAPPVVPLTLAPSASAEAKGESSTESASAEASAGSSSSTVGPALPALADKATLTVQVTPAKALVTLDGEELGRGSGSFEVDADQGQHTLEVSAKGWGTTSRTVSLDKDLTVVIDLVRKGKGKEAGEEIDEAEGGSSTESASAEAKGGSSTESASAEASAGSSSSIVEEPAPAQPEEQPPVQTEKDEPDKAEKPAKPKKKKKKRQIDAVAPW